MRGERAIELEIPVGRGADWPELVHGGGQTGVAEQAVAFLETLPDPLTDAFVPGTADAGHDAAAALPDGLLLDHQPATRFPVIGPQAVLPVDPGFPGALTGVAEHGAHQARV